MAAEFEKGAKIERLERAIQNPAGALRQIGAIMVAESHQAFRDQRFGDVSWPARGGINVLGIIADFAEGKKAPPQRRFETRPALRDTGRLMQSIAFRIVSHDTVEVGSNLPYATLHHFGGETESKPITEQVREGLAAWLAGPGSEFRKKLGWILAKKFAGKTIKSRVHERPFVGVTRQTIEDVREVVAVKLMEAE